MKNIAASLALAALLFACRQNADEPAPQPNPVDCTGDCLFAVQDATGTIVEMACFSRLGILTDDPNTPEMDTIIGLPDWLDQEFSAPGKQVEFSGTFRANTLTPQFPDPPFILDDIYLMTVVDIQAGN
jgi:hypothetical protein